MSYRVRMLDEVKATIYSWGLPKEALLEVLNHLHVDVGQNPDEFLYERIIPLGETYTHSFVIPAGDLVTDTCWFVFHIQRDDVNRQLWLVQAWMGRQPPDEGA